MNLWFDCKCGRSATAKTKSAQLLRLLNGEVATLRGRCDWCGLTYSTKARLVIRLEEGNIAGRPQLEEVKHD